MPISELNKINEQFCREKVINIGTHNHLGSCIFGDIINHYSLKHPNINLNLVCEETPKMMQMLKERRIRYCIF